MQHDSWGLKSCFSGVLICKELQRAGMPNIQYEHLKLNLRVIGCLVIKQGNA